MRLGESQSTAGVFEQVFDLVYHAVLAFAQQLRHHFFEWLRLLLEFSTPRVCTPVDLVTVRYQQEEVYKASCLVGQISEERFLRTGEVQVAD